MADGPVAVTIPAADGYPLGGFVWRHGDGVERPVVIINAATSVRCRYYSRFADFLHGHGFNVVTYDYRGIGESRPGTLRGFRARWLDWGRLDFEGALRYGAEAFPGQPIQVVAHSVGGFLVGLAPSNHRVERVFTMGAQYACWWDYAFSQRPAMFLKWHVLMPALAGLLGYFPGERLGWLEDTPKGVVRDWSASRKEFEAHYRRAWGECLKERFRAVTAPTLAVSISDDPFGTVAAIERLLGRFESSPAVHLRVPPGSIGEREIGHFAFFHSRFRESLWPVPLGWLRDGKVPEGSPGEVICNRSGNGRLVEASSLSSG